MADLDCDHSVLVRFERDLDPRAPEGGEFGAKVLGYGEMSTVLALKAPGAENLCFKRMPMFETAQEVEDYRRLYGDFLETLETAGVRAAPSRLVEAGARDGAIVLYIVQERLAPGRVAQKLLHQLGEPGLAALARSALRETAKVFRYNQSNTDNRTIAIDGQLSNFGLVAETDLEKLKRGEAVDLVYIDTSTPLMLENGKERLDTELFLRAAPGWLKPALRAFAVQSTVTRYYDQRTVAIDMLANLYKEQLADAIPALVDVTNGFFAAHAPLLAPITLEDVQRYYSEDANIWRLYLGARKIDRWSRRILGRPYPYILPVSIKR